MSNYSRIVIREEELGIYFIRFFDTGLVQVFDTTKNAFRHTKTGSFDSEPGAQILSISKIGNENRYSKILKELINGFIELYEHPATKISGPKKHDYKLVVEYNSIYEERADWIFESNLSWMEKAVSFLSNSSLNIQLNEADFKDLLNNRWNFNELQEGSIPWSTGYDNYLLPYFAIFTKPDSSNYKIRAGRRFTSMENTINFYKFHSFLAQDSSEITWKEFSRKTFTLSPRTSLDAKNLILSYNNLRTTTFNEFNQLNSKKSLDLLKVIFPNSELIIPWLSERVSKNINPAFHTHPEKVLALGDFETLFSSHVLTFSELQEYKAYLDENPNSALGAFSLRQDRLSSNRSLIYALLTLVSELGAEKVNEIICELTNSTGQVAAEKFNLKFSLWGKPSGTQKIKKLLSLMHPDLRDVDPIFAIPLAEL